MAVICQRCGNLFKWLHDDNLCTDCHTKKVSDDDFDKRFSERTTQLEAEHYSMWTAFGFFEKNERMFM